MARCLVLVMAPKNRASSSRLRTTGRVRGFFAQQGPRKCRREEIAGMPKEMAEDGGALGSHSFLPTASRFNSTQYGVPATPGPWCGN